jgi:hypothetical protein
MWRVLVALALLAGTASAQPAPFSWRPPTGCGTGDAIVWSGTVWGCGAAGGGVTNSAGANVLMKSDGTNAVASTLSDSAGVVTSTSRLVVTGGTNASPGQLLLGTSAQSGRAWFARGNDGAAGTASIGWFGPTDDTVFGLYTFSGGNEIRVNPSATSSFVTLWSTSGGGTNAERLRVEPDGDVCIGATSCSTTLGVTGTGSFTGNLSTNGNLTAGDSIASDSHTINGRASVSSSESSVAALRATWTPVASTTSGIEATRVTADGTYNTTSGTVLARAFTAVISATRSTGSNDLQNVAAAFGASGGQVNVAVTTSNGSNYLNTSSGNTGIGYAFGATLPSALSVSGAATITGSTTLGSSSANTHTVNGNVAIGTTPDSAIRLLVASPSNGDTRAISTAVPPSTSSATKYGLRISGNTSPTGSTTYGVFVDNESNNVVGETNASNTNYGVYGRARAWNPTGTAYGVYGTSEATSGATGYSGYFDAGAFQVNGAATFADALTVNSTTTLNGDVVLGGSSSTISFSNGPSGINNYDGTHLEWTDEFMVRGPGLTCANTHYSDTYLCQGAGTSNRVVDVFDLSDTASMSGRVGVVAFATGTTTTGVNRLTTSNNSVILSDGTWTYEAAIRLPTLSTGTDEYTVIVGFHDTYASANQVDGCYFLYDRGNVATSGPNSSNLNQWSIWCASNSTRSNAMAGASGNISAATWYRLKIVATGSLSTFYVNGTQVGTISSNVPTGHARGTNAGFQILKSAGTADRYLYLDQTRLAVDLSAARSP